MLQWPRRAARALAALFAPLQDVDVYVEDICDEVFYSRLLNRIAQGRVRVVRAIALGDRAAVIAEAASYLGSRPALFLIDGDLDWVAGVSPPAVPRLYRLDAYCIENLLVDESAAVRLLVEEAVMHERDASKALDFGGWVQDIEIPLAHLFCVFAAAHVLGTGIPTVSRGVGSVCTAAPKGECPG